MIILFLFLVTISCCSKNECEFSNLNLKSEWRPLVTAKPGRITPSKFSLKTLLRIVYKFIIV
jgi:hypothetical protein